MLLSLIVAMRVRGLYEHAYDVVVRANGLQ
jgi:hypothetical protein